MEGVKIFTILKSLFEVKKDSTKTKKIPLFYYQNEFNFGDVLSVEILSKLFNIEAKYAKPKNAKLIAIGSILEFFLSKKSKLRNKSELVVWGSGFIIPPQDCECFNRKLKILALRGKLTKDAAEKK